MSTRKIGLALGGGGGKGAAHIGVLSTLEALRVPIDVLAGTSIGGIVAALYAVGYRPDEIESWFRQAVERRLFIRDQTNTGLIGTVKLRVLFEEAFGKRTFADVETPVALVAVDVRQGCVVVLREGPLVEAVLATCAIPMLFPPVIRGEEILVDGGVLDNVPVEAARELGAERVIAVDLGIVADEFTLSSTPQTGVAAWSPQYWLPRNQFALGERALSVMMAHMSEVALTRADPVVLLRPAVGPVQTLDFTRTTEGRVLGEQAAQEQEAALAALRDWRLTGPAAAQGKDVVQKSLREGEPNQAP